MMLMIPSYTYAWFDSVVLPCKSVMLRRTSEVRGQGQGSAVRDAEAIAKASVP